MAGRIWLVRSRLAGRLPLGEGRTLVSHVLGRTRVVCPRWAIELLDSFEWPKAADEPLEQDEARLEGEAKAARLFRTALLLRAAGNGESERIRDLYSVPLSDASPAPELFPRLDLASPGLQRESELDPDVPLRLSRCLATLELKDDSWLVTHPAGDPVRISSELWTMARRFQDETTPRTVSAGTGGDRDAHERMAACRFLERKRLLWRSEDAERQAGLEAAQAAQSAEVELLYPPLNRWRQTAPAYGVEDVREPGVQGRIALVGPCKVQQIAASLERSARHAGWALDIEGFIWPEPGLARHDWLAIVMPCSQFAVDFYEALSEQDGERCRDRAAAALGSIESAIASIRRHSRSPLYAFSIGRPGLSPFESGSPFEKAAVRILADLNLALHAKLQEHAPARLLDEDRLAADFRQGAFWDDDFNAVPHHSPISSWNWAVLKPGVTDTPYDPASAVKEMPVRQIPQADPSAALALAVVRELTRDHTRKVELLIFEPNALLWPGRLEEGEAPYVQAPTFYADVEDYFYSGLHEALSILRRRGIRLACASSCPTRLLRERWQVKSKLRNVLRLENIELIHGGPESSANVREVLKQTAVDESAALLVDLSRSPPEGFACRVYRGDPWNLRRYLLTAPELSGRDEPALPPYVQQTLDRLSF